MTVQDDIRAPAADAIASFDPYGPLPTGTTVLEASAGTGKTHAIVGLAVRYVAEAGVEIGQLLLVTFSRAATQELRERARDRFVTVAAALADAEAARAHADDLVRHLADADAAEVRRRRARLLTALSDFDAGTIATTHSFCQRMLDELGLAGEHDPGSRLVESVDELTCTVADDLYLHRYARTTPPFSLKEAHTLALAAVRDRHARLVPRGDGTVGERVAFAEAVRAETERRKRLAGLRDFDDLLVLLHDVLADPDHGPRACARIRDRYRVALVDEFQDTDPLQWDILRRSFHGATTLVLVGDPKQAIYAFRGAEVLSYLDAVAHADQRSELTTNWRSDAGLLAALERVQGGAALGHPEITVYPVAATRPWSRLSGPTELVTPMRVRCLPRTGAGPLNKSGFPSVGRQRAKVADDLAADIVRLLESGVRLTVPASTNAESADQARESLPDTDIDGVVRRPVGPGDIAVLVRTRSQIDVVRAALDRVGVASVLAGGTSVFGTPSATDWLWVLRALEQPHRSDRVRLAACTPILGCTAADIDSGGADLVGRVSAQLREAARLFARAGFAAVYEKLSAETGLAPRLLSIENGERQLTDLRHIAQLLDQVALTEGLGLTALTRWLADQVRDPAASAVADRSRRLDRDAAAVQIATVHASKGLEFPIVYLPFAWDSAKNPYPATLLFHDDGARVLDVGGQEAVGYAERKLRSEAEEAGEELRLLYVALTRAMCQVVAWWAPAITTAAAPLHRMILGRPDGGETVPGRAAVPADQQAVPMLAAWAAAAPEAISVSAVAPAEDVEPRRVRTEQPGGDLAAARFDRVMDQQWRRTSYSAITAGAHEIAADTEPEDARGPEDEPSAPSPDTAEPAIVAAPSLMNALPYGAEFGTLVHGVLERIDTGAADLDTEVHTRCRAAVEELMADIDPAVLGAALLAVLRTPLGFGCLAGLSRRDQLAELEFELPLAGGDTPAARAATLRGIADLLREHLPPDDDLASYADLLASLDDIQLRGYLTGSIDAVLRIADPSGAPRFVVVDYKTNRLGTGDLTVDHYTRERMAAEMLRSHYPLQALLYSVALHRYLRWRLPGYDPSLHLGGCRYLFVRGMVGPETPPGRGVFDWTPPVALITALSDLLAGEDR
ncbi:UvrD-helicase domain-containing protein [Nocardia amikacinitolerans]|uniref:UvrD-helicase domain-containing protein n=1 Tax=Nocardia amikacinitolerans TaxID=756689 RepID=UPI0020A5087F|nr:UvrD-helicase domain-containing protein [Nocardia amikacinitolerans]MCP2289793.1 exodeoxyribonuclease V beta subunit [Nocardia amikacinitolerans]